MRSRNSRLATPDDQEDAAADADDRHVDGQPVRPQRRHHGSGVGVEHGGREEHQDEHRHQHEDPHDRYAACAAATQADDDRRGCTPSSRTRTCCRAGTVPWRIRAARSTRSAAPVRRPRPARSPCRRSVRDSVWPVVSVTRPGPSARERCSPARRAPARCSATASAQVDRVLRDQQDQCQHVAPRTRTRTTSRCTARGSR